MTTHECGTYNVCLEYDMAEGHYKLSRSHGTDRVSEHDILSSILVLPPSISIRRTLARAQYNYAATDIDSATE
jgi:hypothetical protein